MLEIIGIILLWREMGKRMRHKGYRKPFWFQFFVPLGWIVGQLAGAVGYSLVGAAGSEPGFDPLLYLAALVGAGLGAGAVFVAADAFPRRSHRSSSGPDSYARTDHASS